MKDRPLTPGEIGCALSHIGVWKRVHRRGLAAVVLEDDAELFNSFKSFYFRELSLFLQRCDIVKFEGLFFPRTSLSGPMLFKAQSTRLIIPFQPTMGSAGYALTRRGAEVLLRCTTHITMPIDFLLRDYPGHGAVYGETRPMLAKQGNFVSNIEAERHVTGKVSNKRSLWRGIRRSLAMIRIVLVAKVLRPMLTR
jgi:glycosyl transferase family 25